MAKTLYNRHNKIFLDKLRELREARNLRQADLAELLGRTQNRVSNVERGETRLDVIELRDWLDALGYDFLDFLGALDSELRALDILRIRAPTRKRGPRSNRTHVSQPFQAGPLPEK